MEIPVLFLKLSVHKQNITIGEDKGLSSFEILNKLETLLLYPTFESYSVAVGSNSASPTILTGI